MKKLFTPLLFLFIIVAYFYKSFFFLSLLPIPSDTIIGLYHPFRDLYASEYPRGIPYKNSLITDPVVQQLPWRSLAIEEMKRMQLPLWNPYAMAGTPLLANIQTASLYPLNILFFILPFALSWSVLIMLQQILGGTFLYLYLKNRNLDTASSLLGAIAFSFSGFFIAWLEWGTVVHTVLWIPLILLCIDQFQISNFKFTPRALSTSWWRPSTNKILLWSILYIFALCSSFLAGHLQTFIYVFVLSWTYFLFRWYENKNKKVLITFILNTVFFILITAIQWVPLLQLLILSARNIDLSWTQDGWFIPWEHLAQFIVPDYFGNPATGNYFGTWNYGEFIGYVGVIPFTLAIFALLKKRDKEILFWGVTIFICLLFATGSMLGKLPYLLNVPFLSATQPTRLISLICLSLAILSAYGFNLLQKREKSILSTLLILGFILLSLITSTFLFQFSPELSNDTVSVARRNLILPTLIFIGGAFALWYVGQKKEFYQKIGIVVVLLFICCDLLYFSTKFTPFTKPEYLFPQTSILSYLQQQKDITRIMTTDARILPPNFSIMYKLQSIDGYDPLYLMRYGELMAASGRNVPDIKPPFGFSRIVRSYDYQTRIINLLGVRYILSLDEINRPEFKKVAEEGQTKLYENPLALSRVFFVNTVIHASSKQEAIEKIFDETVDLKSTAILEGNAKTPSRKIFSGGSATIASYSENKVVIETQNSGEGFLVLVDTYYPGWHAYVDGNETPIYRTDYHFRGIVVPAGKHKVEYKISLL